MVLRFFMSRSTRRLTDSFSGFKTSQKTGHGIKSRPTDWEKPGIEPATPGKQDISLSPTPRWLVNFMAILASCSLCHHFACFFNALCLKKLGVSG